MTSPASARRAATQERLVSAAIPVIAQKGVGAASVEEICEAAGFTRGAFYSNFDGKDELCVAILEARGRAYLEAGQEAVVSLEADAPLDDRIGRAVDLFVRAAGDDANSVLVMSELRLHAAREASVRAAFHACDESLAPAFRRLVEDGLRASGLRLVIPLDQALALLHAVFDQTALDQLVRGGVFDPRPASEALAGVLRALVTPA